MGGKGTLTKFLINDMELFYFEDRIIITKSVNVF
jgi:hypothetical protein